MIGTMLPGSIVVQQTDTGVESGAVDPVASMAGVANPEATAVAEEVRVKLQAGIRRTAARGTR